MAALAMSGIRNHGKIALAASAIVLALSEVAIAGGSFELKGIAPGMTFEALKQVYPDLHCSEPDELWFEACLYSPNLPGLHIEGYADIETLNTIAGAKVGSWNMYFGPGARLAELTVSSDPSVYGDLLTSLSEKFGRPTRTLVHTYQNAFGGTFSGREAIWVKGDQYMKLTEYAGSRELLLLEVVDRQRLAGLNARKAAAARKKAKDL